MDHAFERSTMKGIGPDKLPQEMLVNYNNGDMKGSKYNDSGPRLSTLSGEDEDSEIDRRNLWVGSILRFSHHIPRCVLSNVLNQLETKQSSVLSEECNDSSDDGQVNITDDVVSEKSQSLDSMTVSTTSFQTLPTILDIDKRNEQSKENEVAYEQVSRMSKSTTKTSALSQKNASDVIGVDEHSSLTSNGKKSNDEEKGISGGLPGLFRNLFFGNKNGDDDNDSINKIQQPQHIISTSRKTSDSYELGKDAGTSSLWENDLSEKYEESEMESRNRRKACEYEKISWKSILQKDSERFYKTTFLGEGDTASIDLIRGTYIKDCSSIDDSSFVERSDCMSLGSLADTSSLRRALLLRKTVKEEKEFHKKFHVPSVKKTSKEQQLPTINIKKETSLSTSNHHVVTKASNKNKIGVLRRMTTKESLNEIQSKLPEYSMHTTALLFVDISGFTKLSTLLDVEVLSKTINKYFELIVNEINECGGDILKFAGDALFAEWPVITDNDRTREDAENVEWLKTGTYSLKESVYCAALCGANIVEKCSDFQVTVPKENETGTNHVATLNVHCGIGAGDVASLYVGDSENRKEFLLLGDPIDQVAKAEECASVGELAASPEAIALLRNTCLVDESILPGSISAAIIARRSKRDFQPKHNHNSSVNALLVGSLSPQLSDEKLLQYCEKINFQKIKKLHSLLSAYVHPVVRSEEVEALKEDGRTSDFSGLSKSEKSINSQWPKTTLSPHMDKDNPKKYLTLSTSLSSDNLVTMENRRKLIRAEAELRSVFVIFVMPKIKSKLTGNKDKDEKLIVLLNSIMCVVMRELDRYKGHLRQFIVDDKGVVLIGTFGLRGSAFLNMISKHGLPATLAIHKALSSELNVDNRVGATIGKVYCGVVGGVSQHEFAVLGPSVNLAARLMASPKNPGVLVDDAVRLQTTNRYAFKLVSRVMAKGYATLVPIFEPVEARASNSQKSAHFVGRRVELNKIIGTVNQMLNSRKNRRENFGMWSGRKNLSLRTDYDESFKSNTDVKARFVSLIAEPGLGKSTLLFEATQRIQRLLGMNHKQSLVFRSTCVEREQLLPFSTLARIFSAALSQASNVQNFEMNSGWGTVNSSSIRLSSQGTSLRHSRKSNSTLSSKDYSKNFRHSNNSMRLSKVSMQTYSFRAKHWASYSSSVSSALSSFSAHNSSSRQNLISNMSGKNIHGPSSKTTNPLMSKIYSICKKLGKSTDYALFVGQHLLKIENVSIEGTFLTFTEDDLESFITEAFLLCLESEITLITLDDIQWIDSYSWRVIQNIFEKASNMVIICTSRPPETYLINHDQTFMNDLRTIYEPQNRFSEIKLSTMSLADIHALCASLIFTSEERIDPSLYKEIFERSGGNPMFAREMLEEIKQFDMLDMNEQGLIIRRQNGKELSFKIFEEHFLNKLDTLDARTRSVLQLCAILRNDFSFADVEQLYRATNMNDAATSIKSALDNAVTERILVEVSTDSNLLLETIQLDTSQINSKVNGESLKSTYRFTNEKWLQTVLSTMLDERVRNLHKFTAEILEQATSQKNFSIYDHIKLFEHWKQSGNIRKAIVRAISICDLYPDWNFYQQCLFLLNESFTTLRNKIGDLIVNSDNVVLDSPSLKKAETIDVELLVKLRLEIGRRLLMHDEWEKAAGSFLRAIAILEQCTKHTARFEDTTIFLDVARGISLLLAEGIISTESAVFKSDVFIEALKNATEQEKDPVHLCATLTFESLALACHGRFGDAIAIQDIAESLYLSNERMSERLIEQYGIDRVAYCASYAIQWYELSGETDDTKIEERIHRSVNDFISPMDQSKIGTNFLVILPLVLAMKDRPGMASKAMNILDEFITKKQVLDEDIEIPLLRPLSAVLEFAVNLEEIGKVMRILDQRDAQEWIIEGNYDFPMAFETEGICLIAELCLMIAQTKKKKFRKSTENRKALVMKGLRLAEKAIESMVIGGGLYAFRLKQVQRLFNALKEEAPRFAAMGNPIKPGGEFYSSMGTQPIRFDEWTGNNLSYDDAKRSNVHRLSYGYDTQRRGSLRKSVNTVLRDRLPRNFEAIVSNRYDEFCEEDDGSSFG